MKAAGWIGGIAVVALIAPFALTLSNAVCACIPDGQMLAMRLGVNPMRAEPEASRRAFLQKLPPGSSKEQLRDVFGYVISRCREEPGKLKCEFDVREGLFGQFREGYRLEVKLDGAGNVADSKFETYRK